MYQERLNCAGVYQIRNLDNDYRYIGSTINLRKRKNRHFSQLKLGTHYNSHLQRAYKNSQPDRFVFEKLIECDSSLLIWYEQQFIDQWKPEYNQRTDATTNLGFTHSKETKQKLSEIQLGRKLNSQWLRNRDVSRYNNLLDSVKTKKFQQTPYGSYKVIFRHKYIGVFKTHEEAQAKYKELVDNYIKEG